MSVLLIAYDLTHKPPSVYAELIKALEAAGAAHAQGSVWLLESPYSAEQNYNWLKPHLRQGDQLLVTPIDLPNSWATLNSSSLHALSAMNQAERFKATTNLLRLAGITK